MLLMILAACVMLAAGMPELSACAAEDVRNILPHEQFTQPGRLGTGGITVFSDDAYVTVDGFIPVEADTDYIACWAPEGLYKPLKLATLVYYDSAQAKISGEYWASGRMHTPPDAAYIRVSLMYEQLGARPMICRGSSIPQTYIAPQRDSQTERAVSGADDIVCWGDSLTYGTGAANLAAGSYPARLAQMTGRKVWICGYPGDTSVEIAGYQGAMPLMVEPVTIPEAGSVEVTLYDAYRSSDTPFRFPAIAEQTGVNPVVIAGVEGQLDLSAASNASGRTFRFTRTEEGAAVRVAYPTPLITACSRDRKDGIAIIWVGTNGGFDSTAEWCEQIERMVSAQGTADPRYIVVGLLQGTAGNRASHERQQLNAFGKHFFNARAYLAARGLADNGMTPTAADAEAIAKGTVPPSLFHDAVHLNDAGYFSLATGIYLHGQALGYWK